MLPLNCEPARSSCYPQADVLRALASSTFLSERSTVQFRDIQSSTITSQLEPLIRLVLGTVACVKKLR